MSTPQPNADLYSHIRVVISIIVGLCITTLLSGLARFVQHPRRYKVSILHIGWACSLLLWVIHFWWWEFHLNLVPQWTFEIYFFLISYAVLFFLISKILFPEDIQDYSGYEEYFLSRRRWFFGLLALAFVADIVDTRLKGTAYLHSFGVEYPLRISLNLAICCIGFLSPKRRVQLALMSLSLIYHVFMILFLYRFD